MNCKNCGKNYANVKYTQIINGNKREMFLCEECSKDLGIEDFNISMDFSTFLGDFFDRFEQESIFPQLLNTKNLRCQRCNSSFEDFINTGRFGCEECYSTFEEKIDHLLRNIQGASRHVGRLGELNYKEDTTQKCAEQQKADKKENTEINKLKQKLKTVIKEEKYEEAAILRDKIKKLEGEK